MEGDARRKCLVDDPLAFQGQFRSESVGARAIGLARRVTVKMTKTDLGAVEHGARVTRHGDPEARQPAFTATKILGALPETPLGT